ncbi:MAG: phosphate ABC transporter permease PstA [Myxococcota bacterium]
MPSLWRVVTAARDGLALVLIGSAAIVVFGVFGALLFDVVSSGLPRLSPEFVTDSPSDFGRLGGIGPILVSTAMILGVCFSVALPVGLGCAIWLSEYEAEEGGLIRLVRRSLDVLAGLPSIVFGLFGYAFFCQGLGLGFSILSGGLTLSCMVLPILVRSVEVALRAVPDDLRAAATALGFSKTATIRQLILPAALPGVLVGVILGIGRALAETAALLFTSGYVTRMPSSVSDSGRALSVHVYDLAMNVPGGDGAAYASAFVLLVLLIAMNTVATGLVQHWQRRKGWTVS